MAGATVNQVRARMPVSIISIVTIVAALLAGTADAGAQVGEPDREPTVEPALDEPELESEVGEGEVRLRAFEQIQYPDVRGITQDAQGLMWFGVNHQISGGLIRHDGYSGVDYSHSVDNDTSLSHDQVSVTYIDHDGVLWVGTIRGGLNRYNADTDDFTRYLHVRGDDTTLPSDDIKAIVQATNGVHWVGTEAGLGRLDVESGVVTSYLHDPDDANSLPGNRVQAIMEDPATGELWLGTSGGLSVFDPDTDVFRNYLSDESSNTLSDESVQAIRRDAAGVWWIGTAAGLDRYNPETDDFTTVSTGAEIDTTLAVQSLLEDSQGRLWVGHAAGLHLFDREQGQLVDFVDQPTLDAVIGQSSVHALFEDADGAIWIGTRISGVARVSPVPKSIEYFRHDPANPTSIKADFVARVDAVDNGLWLVTEAGVEFFDGVEFTDHTSHFGLEDGWPKVHGILAGDDDLVWLGFNDGRLARVDPDTGESTTFTVPTPAQRAAIWPVAQAANGDVWYRVPWGFGVGVLRPDGESSLLIGDSLDAEGPELAYGYNTSHYFDAENQLLWITGLGLTRIDVTTSEVDVFWLEPQRPESVVNQLWSVTAGPDGRLWVTSSNGVHEFDPVERQYGRWFSDELPAPGATDARFGSDGRLWIVSVSTLTGLDVDTGEITTYSAADDSLNNDRLDMENWVASKLETGPDDRLYAPTLEEGLVAFSPTRLDVDPTPPNVVLTGFEVFGEDVPVGGGVLSVPPILTTEINLAPNQKTFTFEFSAPDYEHPEHRQYRYRLDGFDTDWQPAPPDRRYATYTNVPPGEYTFRVQASNGPDEWGPGELAVAVIVDAPWYQTFWARLIGVLALVALMVVVVRWRTRHQRQRTRELEERLDERLRHQAERESLLAREREQSVRLQGILEAAPVGVVLLGPDRRVLIDNPVAAEQFAALATCDDSGRLESFAGIPVDELIGGQRANTWLTTTVEQHDATRTVSLTVRTIDRDLVDPVAAGTIDEAPELASSPSRSNGSAPDRGWVLIWDDITELQDLQQRRARQERLAAVGRFAAGIAHDVNNVLTVIGLNAELLSLDPTVSARSREQINRIARETGNASKVVTQVLDFSRQSVSQPELIDAAAVVGSQLRRIDGLMDPGVALEFRGDGPSTIMADPVQLERVVLNLVKNARDSLGATGTITVVVDHVPAGVPGTEPSVTSTGQAPEVWVRLAVSDDGSGIPSDVLPTIFEPFVSTKLDGQGTGLGLAQVAGISAEHDGRVTVETEVGVGTTVSVLFPAADPSEFDGSIAPNVERFGPDSGQVAVVIDGELVSVGAPLANGNLS